MRDLLALWATLITFAFSGGLSRSETPPSDATSSRVIAHANAHPDGRAPFTFDVSAYRADTRSLPIGVFDSGIGGLTVLEAILALDAFDNDTLQPGADGRRDFEHERFIYFGDQANMPYGNYPASDKEDYLRELILKDAIFLLGRRYWPDGGAGPLFDKPPVKAIVIACNTATAYGLEDIRASLQAWKLPVPVVGVVEAGARGVMEQIPSAGTSAAVAVLATVGTCSSNAYPKAVTRATGLAGKPVPKIVQQGCVSLAGAIEGDPAFLLPGKNATESTTAIIRADVRSLMEGYRQAGGGPAIGSVVLGCTHFPLAQNAIAAAFADLRNQTTPDGARPFRDLIAGKINMINPAQLTAKELFRSLALMKLRLRTDERLATATDQFYISVPNPLCKEARITETGALDTVYKYGRAPGRLDLEDTKAVPMRMAALPPASASLIRQKLPEVAKRLR